MKTLGFLGGMSYHSTTLYYTQINTAIQTSKGGTNSASLLLHSFNYAETQALFNAESWDEAANKFAAAARHLKAAGAEGLAIGCNIGHRVAGEVEERAGIPVLHIGGFTGEVIRRRGFGKVGLLGTRAVMEGEFILEPMKRAAGNGLEVVVPLRREDREAIDRAVFTELSRGEATDETKKLVNRLVEEMVEAGCEAIVLACTDLQFVLRQEDVPVPVLDTLEIHARGLAEWCLEEEEEEVKGGYHEGLSVCSGLSYGK